MNTYFLFLNGPNLSMLGHRQPQIYGTETLEQITLDVSQIASKCGFGTTHLQTNHEGIMIDFLNQHFLAHIQGENGKGVGGILINPGAWTHTSVALLDALSVFSENQIPIVEVHISNVFRREEFRKKSFIHNVATGVISGLGVEGYRVGMKYLCSLHKS
jgi:3-dehydroquinate dehydratase-2